MRKSLQRTVAPETSYGSSTDKFITVSKTKKFEDWIHSSNNNGLVCWFGGVLWSIKIATAKEEIFLASCSVHRIEHCNQCFNKPDYEFRFERWYEVLSKDILKIDAIEKAFNCLRLE